MRVTLADIAEKAEVAVSTVSRVLTGNDQVLVGEATRQRITQIAEELGYQPNLHARALSRGKASLISVVVRRTRYHTPNVKIFSLLNALDQLGRDVSIVAQVLSGALLQPVRTKLLVGAPEAVVLLQPPWDPRGIEALCEELWDEGAYTLLVDYDDPSALDPDLPCDAVWVDRAYGFYLATSHLLECGHRYVGMLAATDMASRLEGYEQALTEHGAQDHSVELFDGAAPAGSAAQRAVQQLLERNPRITALVCGSDLVAVGAMRGLYEMGLQVPGDVAVVGFDGDPWTPYLPVSLSTVSQPVAELCQTAADLLSERLEGADGPWQRIAVKPRLLVRESSGTTDVAASEERGRARGRG